MYTLQYEKTNKDREGLSFGIRPPSRLLGCTVGAILLTRKMTSNSNININIKMRRHKHTSH